MRLLLVCTVLVCASRVEAAGRDHGEVEILTVRSAQAELRGRPTMDSAVVGLVRRGETVEMVRSSADKRWVQVEIGGGELAWIEARAIKEVAASREVREAPREVREAPREVREAPREVREAPREVREAPREVREAPRPVHVDPPPAVAKQEPRPVHVDAAPKVVAKLEPAKPALREIPAAKPGELFAADLDDERPPMRRGETTKRGK